ncbi:hypothetical protein ACUN24_00845 [Pedobacter sp. WC2501]|uniref:hypothetical protein n=1 Tax=Pedobacter sp. WC2501 TaxID=3461400 RepID=UPI0040463B60
MCFSALKLEDIANLISVFTPIILLLWFYYSQKQALAKIYFDRLSGIYAGFVSNIHERGSSAAIILNIRETDGNGFFTGDFDHREIGRHIGGDNFNTSMLIDGVYTFTGKLNFEIWRDKTRNPYKPKENRIYKGNLFLVDRLDFQFDNYNLEDYVRAEYEVIHLRDMQTLKFKLLKNHRANSLDLPETFILYKKIGFTFEPYEFVKTTVFGNNTRVDT